MGSARLVISDVAFPEHQKILLKMADEDQKETRAHTAIIENLVSPSEKERESTRLAKNCHQRANKMLTIVRKIKTPTIGNIGLDGCKAVSLLALHSYLDIMEVVLSLFQSQFEKDLSSTYVQGIPPLCDRVSILKTRKQIFGTNWMIDGRGRPFLVAVKDFQSMNEQRARYGLGPARRPKNLSIGAERYPLGKGLAKERDQKDLTEEEYAEYARYYLRSMV